MFKSKMNEARLRPSEWVCSCVSQFFLTFWKLTTMLAFYGVKKFLMSEQPPLSFVCQMCSQNHEVLNICDGFAHMFHNTDKRDLLLPVFFISLLSIQWPWLITYPGLNLRADRWPPRTQRKTRMWLVPKSRVTKWEVNCLSVFDSDHLINLYLTEVFTASTCKCCIIIYFSVHLMVNLCKYVRNAVIVHPLFLRVRWIPSLSTAHSLSWQPPMVLIITLPTVRATMPPELPGLPLRGPPKSPTRGTLIHNLLLTDSLSQTPAKEMVSNI